MSTLGIYGLMERDWLAYCLMSAVIYIEEMSKPTRHIQIKKYKKKSYSCLCFHSIRLKMNDGEIIEKYFNITRGWEAKRKQFFIGPHCKNIKTDAASGQRFFYLSPVWLNEILAVTGRIPNVYGNETAVDRISHLKRYPAKPVPDTMSLFDLLLANEKLAAGAFIVSMDFECRGIQSGSVTLCMSEKFKDFLEFMFDVAKTWGWAKNKNLSPVNVSYSRDRGVKASNQHEFRITMSGLKKIYELAGPLADSFKNKCIDFHIKRSNNYKNDGYHVINNTTKNRIFAALGDASVGLSTTDLQFIVGIRTDVVLDHLHKLEKSGNVNRVRHGKRYLWSVVS